MENEKTGGRRGNPNLTVGLLRPYDPGDAGQQLERPGIAEAGVGLPFDRKLSLANFALLTGGCDLLLIQRCRILYPNDTAPALGLWQCRPLSRGHIRSTDPFEQPRIEPNYFAEAIDRKTMMIAEKGAALLLAA